MRKTPTIALVLFLVTGLRVLGDEAVTPQRLTLHQFLPAPMVAGEVQLSKGRLAVVPRRDDVSPGPAGIIFSAPSAAYKHDLDVSLPGVGNDCSVAAGTEFIILGRVDWPLLGDEPYRTPQNEKDHISVSWVLPEREFTSIADPEFPGHYTWAIHSWTWPGEWTWGTFESDPSYPLVLKSSVTGYTILCGRGKAGLAGHEALPQSLGQDDSVDAWLPRLRSEDQLDREGATQALGWLAKTQSDTEKAVPALTAALKDDAMEVRRNAAEALGRIGDARGSDPLTALLATEKDDWVRDVVEESIGLIRIKTAAPKLPDPASLAAITEGLKHKWLLVRQTAAELLAKAGAPAVEPLIASLKDEDARVRAAAATSLGAIGDARAVDALKQAITEEKDDAAKQAMADALKLL